MITIDYDDASDIDKTVAAAKEADVVIVFGSAHSGEGHDRDNLTLGGNIDDVIPAVASAAPNKTAVVMTVPGSILTPWYAVAIASVHVDVHFCILTALGPCLHAGEIQCLQFYLTDFLANKSVLQLRTLFLEKSHRKPSCPSHSRTRKMSKE